MTTPIVGISWTEDVVARSSGAGENLLRYVALLVAAGLVPAVVSPGAGGDVVNRLDGLLLPGGPDIAPRRYGQEDGPRLGPVCEALDTLELELVDAAATRRLPILGICRGHQLVNVWLGGTLHQHVTHPEWATDPSQPIHDVCLVEGTALRRELGVDRVAVNSGHHQAVDTVAPALTVAATSDDGHVEALESADLRLIAVQWHPEEMPEAELSRRLVRGFARWVRG